MRLCLLFLAGALYVGYRYRDVLTGVARHAYYKVRGVQKRKTMQYIE